MISSMLSHMLSKDLSKQRDTEGFFLLTDFLYKLGGRLRTQVLLGEHRSG